jgi:thymidylate synthase ThyX
MSFSAKVIEDSISTGGVRLTTLVLMYPRFIHAEFMTHRVFSRNASSSRAIPVAKMIEQVRNNPAMPIHWGRNQPGMQARSELEGADLEEVKRSWQLAAKHSASIAEQMSAVYGAHKQVVNRILEPFQFIHVVVTATEWKNFFDLRDHKDAQPEIRELAILMREAMDLSNPKLLYPGEWHLPFVTHEERQELPDATLVKLSAARCARVSYNKHDGTAPDFASDIELYSQLVVRPYTDKRGNVLTESDPIHASPIEHQATPLVNAFEWSGNFRGWAQHRKLFEAKASIQARDNTITTQTNQEVNHQ